MHLLAATTICSISNPSLANTFEITHHTSIITCACFPGSPLSATHSYTCVLVCFGDCVLLARVSGIPEGSMYVHVMYVYRNPAADAPYDDSICVNFKLPVRDED